MIPDEVKAAAEQAVAEAIRNVLGISSPAFMQRQAAEAAVAAAAPILLAPVQAEVERLRLALHREEICFDGCCHYCQECTPDDAGHGALVHYPCPTVRAITGEGK